MKKLRKSKVATWIFITLGVSLSVFALKCFLVPAKIAPGGFSGLATILYHLSGLPVGATVFALNIPLILIGFRKLGKTFTLKVLYAMTLFSVLADVVPSISLMGQEQAFLSSIYGGLINGAGLGTVLYFGGSTGGSDLLGKLVNEKFKVISVSMCMLAIDAAVITVSGVVFNVQAALLAIATSFVSSKMIELFTEGLNKGRAYLIISHKYKEIEEQIIHDLGRGVTEIMGRGAYSGEATIILLCMMQRTGEVVKLKQIVDAIDKNAFMVAWHAKEVIGQGFSTDIKQVKQGDSNVTD